MAKKITSRPGSMANLGIGHVGLNVNDVKRSVEFYQNILGLQDIAGKPRVARIPSGADKLVLHEKSLGMRGFHFGFQIGSSSKVEEWKAWLESQNVKIYDDVTEHEYRSFKIKDPDGHLIEIFCDSERL